ncbi:uncharacterized protein LOC126452454 [Schistocerca serialis cubense]|uniref:uncharacterized protein LOC126452454 n=1 Tax=Schistocerca serialis cubense TaxID=2023355 RepID=UPI00214E1DAE|nr:uncharacterized protein LOC126452454 [Schistocerca serialis cubense]
MKRSRAAVYERVLREYVEHLQVELKDMPPSNIWNFDGTNLTDDPGKKKVLTKRGSKYSGNICNSSKSSISVMLAGNAEGEVLPPFVVYKLAHLWSTWTENGLIGYLYSHSPSGWFDSNTFSEWFTKLMLSRLKKLVGKKVVICDSLFSHLTTYVLALCGENNISFISLPANSTHITQPLDVTFFGPMKLAWRKVLTEWKSSRQGFKGTVLQKQHFPFLLKRLMVIVGKNSAKNLMADFQKCSIYPINVDEILCSLLSRTCDKDAVQDSFIEALENKRTEWTTGAASNRGTKKLSVTPGKSVTVMQKKVLKKYRGSHKNQDSSSGKDSDAISLRDSSEDEDYLRSQVRSPSPVEFKVDETQLLTRPKKKSPEFGEVVHTVGQYVIFKYEGEYFPGLITDVSDDGATISSMQKSKKSWKWPMPRDEIKFEFDEIICTILPPKQISKRGLFSIPKLEGYWTH